MNRIPLGTFCHREGLCRRSEVSRGVCWYRRPRICWHGPANCRPARRPVGLGAARRLALEMDDPAALAVLARQDRTRKVATLRPSACAPGCRNGQEIAAFTSSATFFSTVGLHFCSAYDTGHMSPSSRLAASWKPSVEYRYLNLPES